jgi:periplasmic protein CpxP/Spy
MVLSLKLSRSALRRRIEGSLALAALALACAQPALSQTTTPTPPAAGERHGMMGHGAKDPAKMQAMVQKRLADLKAKLQITPAQEGAWGAFTSAMKPPADAANNHAAMRAEMDKLTTPERIDKMKAMRAQRDAHMDQRASATKLFYAALSPDQQKVFDAQRPMGPRHGGHHGPMGS